MTMNDKDIKRHLQAASRIQPDDQIIKADLERVRSKLNELNKDSSKSENIKLINASGLLRYAAMLTVAAVFGLVAHYGLPFDGTSVVWADVVEKFRSVDNFSAILYMREKISEEPQQVEIWMGAGRKGRIRIADQVLFGQDGTTVAGFDYVKGIKLKDEQFDGKGERLIEMLGAAERFSLDTIVKSFCNKTGLKDVTPMVNADAAISEDLVVFDLRSSVSPEWLRIWALKNSKLPVRVRVFDPRGYDQTDLVITYSKPQSSGFFDPKSYGKAVRNNRGQTNRAYALLEDASGQNHTPKDIFEKTNYHMPVLEEVGITEKGAVWVIARDSQNRKPDGRPFSGYRKLKDDLGREYVSLWSSCYVEAHRSREVFVPKNYPFDDSVPGKLILPYEVEEHHPNKTGELIGTEEVAEWQQDTAWPADRISRSEFAIMLMMANRHCSNSAFDKCDKIIEMITDAGEYDKYERDIDRLRLKMLMEKKLYKEAAELAMEVWPIEMENYKNPGKHRPSPYYFVEPITAVAASGDVEKATELWNEVKNTKPDISHFSKPAQKDFKKHIKRQMDEPRQLVANLGVLLSAEKVSRIVGFDVTKHEDLKYYASRTEAQIEEARKAQEYMEKLSEYYDTHPLPEKMELLGKEDSPIIAKLEPGAVFSLRNLPGHDGYSVWPINCQIEHLVKWGARFSVDFIPRDAVEVKVTDGAAKILKKEVRVEMVYHKDVKVQDRFLYVAKVYLEKNGLELVKTEGAMQKVMVAKYDGRKLKNFKDVTGVPEGDVAGKPGAIGYMSSIGIHLWSHFESLANIQNRDLGPNDEKIIIVDKTGIKGRVSVIGRHFPGEEGLRLAKKWFKEEFGVTFHEEQRPMPVWEVRVVK